MAKSEERQFEELKKIIRGLPMPTQMSIIRFIEEELSRLSVNIKKDSKKEFDIIISALDRNMTAAMIEGTDMNLDSINAIFERSFELIGEDNKKVKKLKKEGNGDWEMAVDKYIDKIQKRSFELLEGGKKQKEAIDILVMEFPKLSRSMVTNAYKKSKEEYKKIQEVTTVEPVADCVVEEQVKEVEVVKPDEKIEPVKILKVINKKVILDLEAPSGRLYHIEDGKIQVDKNQIESKDITIAKINKEIENLMAYKMEIEEVYKMI